MSRIYFHSEHGTAELRGSERAYMGNMCMQQLFIALDLYDRFLDDRKQHWATKLLPPDHYVHGYRGQRGVDMAQTTLFVGQETLTLPDGRTTIAFSASLNTALRVGGDAFKLMARLHGQCELHCWVDGPNRAWLAGIMEQGRAINLYRANEGWEEVIALLRARDDGPVVCSYSVCEQFPNAEIADWEVPEADEGESNWDAWFELSADERWRLGMQGLRQRNEGQRYTLEMRPDVWDDYTISAGISGYDMATFAPTLAEQP